MDFIKTTELETIGLRLTDTERRENNFAVSSEAAAWLDKLDDAIMTSESLTTILGLQDSLEEARRELAEQQEKQGELEEQRRELLPKRDQRAALDAVEKKMHSLADRARIISGRIRELETLIAQQTVIVLGQEIREYFDNLFIDFGSENQRAVTALEAEVRKVQEPLLQLNRATALAHTRGLAMQAFKRDLNERLLDIAAQLLAKARAQREHTAETVISTGP
jgi:hypothetical protein